MLGNRSAAVRNRFVRLVAATLGTAALLMGAGSRAKPAGAEPGSGPANARFLAELAQEAHQFEADARDYQQLLGRIVKHHYQRRRQLLLRQLDRNIAVESRKLHRARRHAIAQLEAFIDKHGRGPQKGEHTPDAMLRLAALYAERAREAAITSGNAVRASAIDLKPAIALYEQIVRDHPSYSQRATTLYHLGHAYFDTAQLERAQQAWRALVCSNYYRFGTTIQALPQDHDPRWWKNWRERRRAATHPGGSGSTGAAPASSEAVFVDPYPHDCRPLQPRLISGASNYIAEAWWRIGDHHFEASDSRGGPYLLNRAASAYRHARSVPRPPVYDVATYKLAWTYYRQQRYRASVKRFVELLHLADLRQQQSGDPGTDFRSEAVTYIAGGLTYRDFAGPSATEPYSPRQDILDTESRPGLVEQQMRVAIKRVQDPQIIPQDKPWTLDIYRALAAEFKEYGQLNNVVELDKVALARFPVAAQAPQVQLEIAESYRALARTATGAEHRRYVRLAREAQDALSNYVDQPGSRPAWVAAHQDDPEILDWARRLLREALRNAAVAHTNEARRLVSRADQVDASRQKTNLQQALQQYRQAARAWGSYLWQYEARSQRYKDRYWLADAHAKVVAMQARLGQLPKAEQVERAQRLARELRDSTESTTLLQPAALLVVRVAQHVVKAHQRVFQQSGSSRGLAPRTRVSTKRVKQGVQVVRDELPAPVRAMIAAFDEYVTQVPAAQDVHGNHPVFAYQAAEVLFLYGHLNEARKRLRRILQLQCGKTTQGFAAWVKLLTIANLQGASSHSQRLVKAARTQSCAMTAADKVVQRRLISGTIEASLLEHARVWLTKAKQRVSPSARKSAWREAAALYARAFDNATDDGAEAALSGAHAYQQAGRYAAAIVLYRKMIERFDEMGLLDQSQAKPARLAQRVQQLQLAYGQLASSYALSFDYARAAQSYKKISEHAHFDVAARRAAAQNAVRLFAALEQPAAAKASSKLLLSLTPPIEEVVQTQWRVVSATLAAWPGARSPDRGRHAAARLAALRALKRFYRRYQGKPAAGRQLVEAAYHLARVRRAGNKPAAARRWCNKAVKAFDAWLSKVGAAKATSTSQADMAAECAYRSIDQALRTGFDYAAGHHRYAGVITEVIKAFRRDVSIEAKARFAQLQTVIEKYGSRRWAVAARARQGSVYDALRTGLYFARPPALKLFTAKEQRLLNQLKSKCQRLNNCSATYDMFSTNRRIKWNQQRELLLADVDKAMVAAYVEAIVWARAWHVPLGQARGALTRLGWLTDVLGDARLRSYTSNIKVPGTAKLFVYTDQMFLRMRPGLHLKTSSTVLSTPAQLSLSSH